LGQRRLGLVVGAGGLVGASAVGRSEDGPARCAPDPGVFQQECIDAFIASQIAQGFSQITIDNGTGVLERFLALADKPVWEITEHDVDRVIAALVKRGGDSDHASRICAGVPWILWFPGGAQGGRDRGVVRLLTA
jgi:hypothetical protein